MPNDNTFICEAVSGRLSEVTCEGQVVWQYMAPAWTGRALKYPARFATGAAEVSPVSAPAVELSCSPFVQPGRAVRVRYRLSAPGRISLRLFDAAGRLQGVLAEGAKAAGSHGAEFPVGEGQCGGAYFLTLDVRSDAGAVPARVAKLAVTE
jgi:hypothetical protein